MRRGRDRYKQRQGALLKYLEAMGLMPPAGESAARGALQNLDPFELRVRALNEALTAHELGRALFHINQRRGFKSNRKADRKTDESGKIRVGVRRLQEAMGEVGARTFGEFLHLRRQLAENPNRIPSVRARLRPESGEGAKGDGYDFYPDRTLLEEEFKAILAAQAPHHPAILTATARKTLSEIVFHQRPLKTPEVGLCTLLYAQGERRLPKAHPLFQRRRLLEEVNALRIVRVGESSKPLDREQRDALVGRLATSKAVSFESLRKALKLGPDARFNKESENRKELRGDEVASVMADKKRFGARWGMLSAERQWDVVYARFCNGKEQFEAYMRRIESRLPQTGDVHILSFTDRQYENIIRFSGQQRRKPRKNPDQLALF